MAIPQPIRDPVDRRYRRILQRRCGQFLEVGETINTAVHCTYQSKQRLVIQSDRYIYVAKPGPMRSNSVSRILAKHPLGSVVVNYSPGLLRIGDEMFQLLFPSRRAAEIAAANSAAAGSLENRGVQRGPHLIKGG